MNCRSISYDDVEALIMRAGADELARESAYSEEHGQIMWVPSPSKIRALLRERLGRAPSVGELEIAELTAAVTLEHLERGPK